MSQNCAVTGKSPQNGHNVSHANNKTKRRFLPNLQKHTYWVPSLKRHITLTVSTHGMRIIDKLGIDQVIAKLFTKNKTKK